MRNTRFFKTGTGTAVWSLGDSTPSARPRSQGTARLDLSLPHLEGVPARSCHASILSRNSVSGNPGAVHFEPYPQELVEELSLRKERRLWLCGGQGS